MGASLPTGDQSGKVEQAVADDRRRAIDGGQIAQHPALGAGAEIVGFHRETAGNDQLFHAIVRPDDGRGIAGEHAGARGFPHGFAGRGVEREDGGVGFQIADEAIGENGRGAAAEVVVCLLARERVPPEFLAGKVVSDESAGAELNDDALTVGRGRRGGRAALARHEGLDFLRACVAAPQLFAVRAVEAERPQLSR